MLRTRFALGCVLGLAWSAAALAQTPPPAQRSLFPEGPCGGLFCSAIGGSQAPKPAGPPPNCGGGLLCDIAPYATGASLSPNAAERVAPEPVPSVESVPVPAQARDKAKAGRRKRTAKRVAQ